MCKHMSLLVGACQLETVASHFAFHPPRKLFGINVHFEFGGIPNTMHTLVSPEARPS